MEEKCDDRITFCANQGRFDEGLLVIDDLAINIDKNINIVCSPNALPASGDSAGG